jgi:outer membrane protein assembly factor BamB
MTSGKILQYFPSAKPALAQQDGLIIQNVTFKLLAVEHYLDNATTKGAEHFIKSLQSFNNWQNNTVSTGFQYSSYIHLLSEADPNDIDRDCQSFYRGRANKANLMTEMSTFLTEKLPFENDSLSVRIFYFTGNTHRIVKQGNTSYCLALDQLIFDWELHEALSQDNSSRTLVILDTYYSGGYITELAGPGRVILTASSPVETVNSWISPDGESYSWFTGSESTRYSNGTEFGPLGIVGGIKTAEDSNRDGWRSAGEIFKLASQTVRWFAANQTDPRTGKPYNLNPWAHFGVAGGGIPLVQHNVSAPFPYIAKVFPATLNSPDPYRHESEEFQHRMYRQSPDHVGYAKTTGPGTFNLVWSVLLSDPITSSAAVADGMAFVGTTGGRLHALEMTSGKMVWDFSAGGSISSSPAVERGVVVFGVEEPGKIYALDEYTSIVRWTYEISEGKPVASSPTIKDEKVFIASSDGYLRAFTLFEGFLLWESYIGGHITASPAVSGGTVFITGNDIYAFDELTGTQIWRFVTSWPVLSSPAADDGVVYVGSGNNDKVYALDATTGNLLWSYTTGGWLSSPSVDSGKGLVLLGCRDSRVYCLDKKTGWFKWAYVTDGANHLSSPTVSANGLLFIGSSDGNLYCLNESSGEKIWSYTTGGQIASSPTVIEERVIIGSQDGNLYCFGSPFFTHHVTASNATVSSTTSPPGQLVEIDYSARNKGNTTENLTVTCAYNRTSIWASPGYLEPVVFHTKTTTLQQGESFTNTCIWNTSNIQPGNYSIILQAALVTDEIEASDNVFIGGTVLLIMLTDLDLNGIINILDIAITAQAYGSGPGDERWNQHADLDNNQIINIVDVATVAQDYGKSYF